MTFNRRLANVTDLAVRGLYCPSTQNLIQKALHEITVNSQSYLNLFSPIVRSLAILQRHIITSPDNQRWGRIRITGVDSGKIFLSDQDPARSQKFVKNRTRIRSHFSISAVAGVCAAEMIG